MIDRAAISGHYPPEFEAIGNDRFAMQRLAERSGGRLIEPSDTSRIEFPKHTRPVSLTSELAFAGCALIALGLVHWRRAA